MGSRRGFIYLMTVQDMQQIVVILSYYWALKM